MDEEPVEILAGMAERGEVDPWNIDIVDVTDRFLAEMERRKELDLRISGRTLFYAATLLRMKSEYLDEADDDGEEGELLPEDDLLIDLDFDFDPEQRGEPMDRLEREIQRRIGRKSVRKRPPVTLYELLKQLKTAEREQRRRQRRRTPAVREAEFEPGADEVVSLAHDEGYQMAVSTVLEGYLRTARGGAPQTLGRLSSQMGWTMRDVYIPLLFLMLEGKVALWQDEFFGEIFVGEEGPPGEEG
ncbi:chromosome segregation protein ScpA [Methanoculleus taiwanensis]|uniref:Chromosome segregation protein ScpA n=1 Tax=Methanoculleus taiwanensis TaxID=1550565 RepID=A0A498H756_9EURY|nr:ScpA family protein [Methanoculleus taiwanensis]RXE57396.1 chromosome segregation protein ScpA [Methanoculleus taiwanensis]